MAGVSRTTVSNVINGNTKRVSQSTIDRITAILKEQNYVPHMGSVMLSGHGSRIIGVVLGFSFIHGMQSLQDSFVGEITGTLQVEAENRGYYIMLIGGERIDNVVDMASRWTGEGLRITQLWRPSIFLQTGEFGFRIRFPLPALMIIFMRRSSGQS